MVLNPHTWPCWFYKGFKPGRILLPQSVDVWLLQYRSTWGPAEAFMLVICLTCTLLQITLRRKQCHLMQHLGCDCWKRGHLNKNATENVLLKRQRVPGTSVSEGWCQNHQDKLKELQEPGAFCVVTCLVNALPKRHSARKLNVVISVGGNMSDMNNVLLYVKLIYKRANVNNVQTWLFRAHRREWL